MKWLVQEFLNRAENSIRVAKALEDLFTEYLLIRLNEDETLSVIDKVYKVPLDNSADLIKEFISSGDVMTYGSKAFDVVTREMDFKPGSFINDNFEFDIFLEKLGGELLNHEFVVGELSELEPVDDEFFIRPTGNTKLIPGMFVKRDEFYSWKKRESIREDSPYVGQSLMVSPIQKIDAEYRFFIVNQEIVTGSSYVVGNIFNTSKKPSSEVLNYTQKMVDKFPISEAFVIDIAETPKGFKVIEYNNINTSGLYGSDELAFIKAINKMTIKKDI